MRSDADRIRDIAEALQRISDKLPSGKDEFLRSELHQIWVLYHIQVIGEAANGLSPAFRDRYAEIPWKDIIAMRHLLIHHYFGIDLDEVWTTATQDLPRLSREIGHILP